MVSATTPTRWPSSAWVKSRDWRRCWSQRPNEDNSSIIAPNIVKRVGDGLLQRHGLPFGQCIDPHRCLDLLLGDEHLLLKCVPRRQWGADATQEDAGSSEQACPTCRLRPCPGDHRQSFKRACNADLLTKWSEKVKAFAEGTCRLCIGATQDSHSAKPDKGQRDVMLVR